jgi:hypothetical protein
VREDEGLRKGEQHCILVLGLIKIIMSSALRTNADSEFGTGTHRQNRTQAGRDGVAVKLHVQKKICKGKFA